MKLQGKSYSILYVKIRKIIIIVFIPFLLLACNTLKPVGKLTDQELIDKYYKTDLKLYMVKRDSGYSPTASPSANPDGIQPNVSTRGLNKMNKIEGELEIMRQELLNRGYLP